MNPWAVKISVVAVSAICKLIGELCWHNAQRFILPVIYSGAVSWDSHSWWLGLTTLPMIVPLDLGYKTYGSNDRVARALWLFAITAVSGLGPTLTDHEPWLAYVLICLASGFIGTGVRNINNLIGAPLNGIILSLHILFIR